MNTGAEESAVKSTSLTARHLFVTIMFLKNKVLSLP